MAPSRMGLRLAGLLIWAACAAPVVAEEAVLVQLDSGGAATWDVRQAPNWPLQRVLATPDSKLRMVITRVNGTEVTAQIVPVSAAGSLQVGDRRELRLAEGSLTLPPAPAPAAPTHSVAVGKVSRVEGDDVLVGTAGPPALSETAVVRRGGRDVARLRWRTGNDNEWVAERTDGREPLLLGDDVYYRPVAVAASAASSAQGPQRKARAWGQEDVVPGDDPVYKALAALAARGAIPGCSARQFAGDVEAVYTHGQLVQFIETFVYALINQDEASKAQLLTPQLAAQAQLLVDRFRPDLVERGVPVQKVDDALRARHAATLALLPTGQVVGRAGTGKHGSTGKLEASLLGAVDRSIRYGITLGTEGGEPMPNTHFRYDIAAYWIEGDLARNLLLGAGRRTFRFGPGANDLLWTDRAKPFDQFYMKWNTRLFGRPLSVDQHLAIYRYQGAKYVALRRVQYLPMRQLSISFDEGLISRDASQAPAAMVMPMYWARFLGGKFSTGGAGNYAFSFDAVYRVNRFLSVYGQYFADDLDLSGAHNTPHMPGMLAGLRLTPGGLPGSSYRIEAAVLPTGNTYLQSLDPGLRWFHANVIDGHEYGPEGAGVRFDGRQRITRRLDVSVYGEYFERNRKQPVPQKYLRAQVRVGYDLTNYWSLSAGFNYRHLQNVNGVGGDNRIDQQLFIQTNFGY